MDIELSDQPPEVTTTDPGHAGSLPPVTAAAARVAAFIRWFGDGMIAGAAHLSPLYARDLEVLVKLAELATVTEVWRIHNGDDIPSTAIDEAHPLAEHYSYLVAAQRDDSYPEHRRVLEVHAGEWERGDPDIEHRVGDECEREKRDELTRWWTRGTPR